MNANNIISCSLVLLLVLLVAGRQHLASVIKMGNCEPTDSRSRLLAHFQPLHYQLSLRLDLGGHKFSGRVDIKLRINDEMGPADSLLSSGRKKILLNAEHLNVYDARLIQAKDNLGVEEICRDAMNNIVVLKLSRELNIKTLAMLTLWFEGDVNTEAKGLFRNSRGTMAANLEPNYSRRVFPCFDEPEFKATFALTIEHPLGTKALSNMPIKSSAPSPDSLRRRTVFETTPNMPTHLLSLVVGEFESIRKDSESVPGTHEGKTLIYIHAPNGSLGYGAEMLGKAGRAYAKVSRFFAGIERPLKEISIVAMYMEARAIQNWGLLTMKRELLCQREELLRPEDRNYAVTALTKVMVRSWLANLVTVRRWDDLWFVEGLANYVTSELTREEFPELSSESYTLLDTTYSAMKDDDHPQRAHAIQRGHLETPDEIRQWYHSSSYKKSEALFRMFAHFLGKDYFNAALLNFIKLIAEGHVLKVDDWWLQLEAIAYPLHAISLKNAHLWLHQAGYPIISVSMSEGRLFVSQESNLRDGKIWSVPFSLEIKSASEGDKYQGKYVLTDSGPKEIPLPHWFNPHSSEHWLKLNPSYEGYYRVVYESPELRDLLDAAVNNGLMPPVDLLQLLSDSYAQIKRAGSMDDFVKLLKIYSKETDPGVMLLLTKLLIDMHESGWQKLARSDEINSLLMNYYELTGRISSEAEFNVLKEYARGQVVYCLVVILKNTNVIGDARIYRMENDRLLPYFEHVDPYLATSS